jgi:hypothetical protein
LHFCLVLLPDADADGFADGIPRPGEGFAADPGTGETELGLETAVAPDFIGLSFILRSSTHFLQTIIL